MFVQCETRTWWTADAGRTWKHREWFKDGPKGTVPSLDKAWFTRATAGLWLGNRNGPLAWAFDTASGDWAECSFGRGVTVSAGSGDRLYALTGDHALRFSRDAGVTWAAMPVPDSVRVGTFFDDLLADGDRVLLRVRDPANSQRPAATLDGGRTWQWLPAHAPTALAHGCAYALAQGHFVASCPDTRPRTPVPFASAAALFTDPGGFIFAWADSALYARTAGTSGVWSVLAARKDLRGWERTRDILFRLDAGTLSWFTGAAVVSGLGPRAPAARKPGPNHHELWYSWLGRGHDGLGRAVTPR